MVNIKQLWARRYWGLILIALIASLLGAMLWANGEISSYRGGIQAHGYASQWEYNSELKDYHKHPDNYSAPIKDFKTWQHDNLLVYRSPLEEAKQMGMKVKEAKSWVLPDYSTGLVVNIPLIIVALLIGAFAAGWDHLSSFDRFIFGLGVKRQKYYWWRTGGLIGVATAGTLISIGGYMAILFAYIPSDIVNLSPTMALAIIAYNWVLSVMGILLGQLIGQVVANPVAVGITSIASMFLGYFAVSNLSTVVAQFTKISSFQLDHPENGYWAIMIGATILALFGAFGGRWVYTHLSLDYPGWLRLHAAIWPTTIAGVILVESAVMFFDEYGLWDIHTLAVQGVIGVIAAGVAYWHHRRMTSA